MLWVIVGIFAAAALFGILGWVQNGKDIKRRLEEMERNP